MNGSSSSSFQWRALTTALVAFAFTMLLVSGIMLFLSPPGRVANWTGWTLLGLSKTQWTGLHIWFSSAFLVMVAFHLFYNWRPLVSYFKDRLTRQVGFRREWMAAAALSAVIAAGTLAQVPPFSTLLAWNEGFKESWEQPADRAPIPHAELLTLQELAEKGGVTLALATERLEASGITGFTAGTVVQEIAGNANKSAQELYAIILTAARTAADGNTAHQPTGEAGGGPGWKTLAQYCSDEGIPVADAIARLAAKGYKAGEQLTLREIAQNNGFAKPYGLIEVIRGQPQG
ncbi:MAG: DUF4405 domain-containing protein [Opitutaceae bacterium]|nr:DUF4405 domain-containing protein [Opitutaceae bacterium]